MNDGIFVTLTFYYSQLSTVTSLLQSLQLSPTPYLFIYLLHLFKFSLYFSLCLYQLPISICLSLFNKLGLPSHIVLYLICTLPYLHTFLLLYTFTFFCGLGYQSILTNLILHQGK